MISAIVGFWIGLPKWAQDALKWVGVGILIFLFSKAMAEALKSEGARKQRDKDAVENAKERERVIETSHQIIEDIEDAKDAAIAAPHSVPVVSSADELREQAPAIAEVILRNRR